MDQVLTGAGPGATELSRDRPGVRTAMFSAAPAALILRTAERFPGTSRRPAPSERRK